MISAVIFDAGNVLFKFDKMRACKEFAKSSIYSAEQIYQLIVGSKLERMLETGKISGVTFCNKLLIQIKSNLTVADVMRIWGDIFDPNPAIEPVINQLIEKRLPLAVLSDTNEIHWQSTYNFPGVKELIRYQALPILSYRIGVLKPDLRMFETALLNLRANPEQTLYLDDLEKNLRAARSLGIKSQHYDCTKDAAKIKIIVKEFGLL